MSQAESSLSSSHRTKSAHSKRQHELPHLNRKLIAYAATAAAAGVSLLALSQRSEAEIIFTKTQHLLTDRLPIDVNNDGIIDFSILCCDRITDGSGNAHPLPGTSYHYYLHLSAGPGNSFVEGAVPGRAKAMQRGQKIGEPPAVFDAGIGLMETFTFARTEGSWYCAGSGGSWPGASPGYLGLKFMIDGQPHYGWARLRIATGCLGNGISGLTGYAYETEPNVHLRAGQKSEDEVSEDGDVHKGSLGWLAAGMSAEGEE